MPGGSLTMGHVLLAPAANWRWFMIWCTHLLLCFWSFSHLVLKAENNWQPCVCFSGIHLKLKQLLLHLPLNKLTAMKLCRGFQSLCKCCEVLDGISFLDKSWQIWSCSYLEQIDGFCQYISVNSVFIWQSCLCCVLITCNLPPKMLWMWYQKL